MAFLIPLKFKDGSIVRNTEQLKAKFASSLDEIILFIESGELERFFDRLYKKELKELIQSLKSDGVASPEIARQVASTLVLQIDLPEEIQFKGTVVNEGQNLQDVLNVEDTTIYFTSGVWAVENQILINLGKTLKGQGSDKTAFRVNKLTVNLESGQNLIIESISIKKFDPNCDVGIIEVLNGDIYFNNVSFEDVVLIFMGQSRGNIIGCKFQYSPKILGQEGDKLIPITMSDSCEVFIDRDSEFDKKIEYALTYMSKDFENRVKVDDFIEQGNRNNNLFLSRWMGLPEKIFSHYKTYLISKWKS